MGVEPSASRASSRDGASEDALLLARYWGKADPALGEGAHHTVLGHSLDVAACAYVLVERHPVLASALAGGAAFADVAITFAALCALHDIGKLDTRFQRKASHVADRLRPESSAVASSHYDHGVEGFRQIEDDEESLSDVLRLLGPQGLPLLRAVCGHHGALPTPDEPAPNRSIPGALRREDAMARRAMLRTVVEFGVGRGARLPWTDRVDGPTVQRLAGLCAVADWVGSNVEHFKYAQGPVDVGAYWERACKRAVDACEASGLLRASASGARFGELFPGKSPRDVQRLTESIEIDEPALLIVEAEMGKGKTEAALSISSRMLDAGLADGVTVALPTMATSNAMFSRVEDVASRMFAGAEIQLALAHGRASREPRFLRLTKHSLRALDPDAPEASVTCARWLLKRKRVLLAQMGVGTIDQALQAALVVRHQFVRMFGLSRNVVVIDEVHAYDAYMEVLLEHLLRWLGALGTPVVLLSATLPSDRRAALVAAWRGTAVEQQDDLEAARTRAYPLVTLATRQACREITASPAVAAPAKVIGVVLSAGAPDDPEHVRATALRLAGAARSGARVVWIRNTVREAQRAFAALASAAPDVESMLFHARFRASDRSAIEQRVLRDFGKSGSRAGRVLIATQVVEQSLDLDFDELHTDLAPIDLLLQRAGRLHRHERDRPPGFAERRLVVHVPPPEDVAVLRFGPSRYVYDLGTLWIAHRALREHPQLRLPDDIRPLVELTYHPASRKALLPLGGPALVEAEERRAAELAARQTRARQCCIPSTSASPLGAEALSDDEDTVQAFTRDGVSATLLPVLWDGSQGRSLDADGDAPAWTLDPGAPDAWRLAGALLDQTLSLPARTDVRGEADASSAAAFEAWRVRFAQFADSSGLGERVVPVPLRAAHDGFSGWLRVGTRRRRVFYSKTLGLLLPTERDEERQR